MRQKHLRPLRVVVSVIFLVSVSALFVDYREYIPVSWHAYILYPQFVPSLIRFITKPSVMATGFLLVLLLTLLSGRVYCSFFCPLGILQDVFSWLSGKFGLIRRYKFRKAMDYLRYPLLAATILFLLSGSMVVLNLLDPFSSFGRIFSDLVRPGIVVINNMLAGILEKMDVYFLFRVDMGLFTWHSVLIPILTAGIVIWLSVSYGRLYCNTACPLGTVLGLVSRISIFRIRMDHSTCTRCGKCAARCKSTCIDVKNMKVDFSRCVSCYNCIAVCPESSIRYTMKIPAKAVPVASADTGKRDFIGKVVAGGLALAGFKNPSWGQQVVNEEKGLIPNVKTNPVTPPGSISIRHFTDRCTACHLCVTVCPTHVLQPSFLEFGLKGITQPRMDYAVEYCNYECTLCSQVCPTGAIMPLTVEDKKLTQIGKVNLVLDKCVVVSDLTACGSCSEHCPTQAVKMVPYNHDNLTIPQIDPAICIGCGACEYACPVRPHTAIFVDGNAVHQVAEAPPAEELETNTLEDFPF